MGDVGVRDGLDWLVSVAPDPQACRGEWERDPLGVTSLPAGELWDVLFVSARLGRPALEVLCGFLGRPGPVLTDVAGCRTGFFVPAGTAARWLGTGVRGVGTGSRVVVPHPGRVTGGVRWLVPPDGSGALTDPAILELALHEAAAQLASDGL